MTVTLRQLLVALYSKLHEEDKRLHMAWSFWLLLIARILWSAPWAFVAVFLLGFDNSQFILGRHSRADTRLLQGFAQLALAHGTPPFAVPIAEFYGTSLLKIR